MEKKDFYFELPDRLIAQTPSPQRAESRLLKLERATATISHHHFSDILHMLTDNDLLVLNNTKVIPARLLGRKETGGNVEIFLISQKTEHEWDVLVRPSSRVKKGTRVYFPNSSLVCEISDAPGERIRRVLFDYEGDFWEHIEHIGKMPLPPYIKREAGLKDAEMYQTVFAEKRGAVAAPTAGLHFTRELLQKLAEKGVEITYVTLHVGYGTFFPVNTDDIRDHTMHVEDYEIEKSVAAHINQAKQKGKRIVACGTTTVRTLESACTDQGLLQSGSGKTNIFIYPPYTFKMVDALITNFHLPESTLLMLVAAFAGRESILHAYNVAKQEEYRFYSYGDALFIT
jgi:S-adenosylmethionine:tRNA ribosyltransferase-isomerase